MSKIVDVLGRQALAFRGHNCNLKRATFPIVSGHKLFETGNWLFGNFAALYLLHLDAGDRALLENLRYGISITLYYSKEVQEKMAQV